MTGIGDALVGFFNFVLWVLFPLAIIGAGTVIYWLILLIHHLAWVS